MKVDREEDTCFYPRFVYIFISYSAKFTIYIYIYIYIYICIYDPKRENK